MFYNCKIFFFGILYIYNKKNQFFSNALNPMLPSTPWEMKLYIGKKASKLSLYIYARNGIRMSAKQTMFFRYRLRRSMEGAVSVKEAISRMNTEIQRLWTSNKFRTMKTFNICKRKLDEFWSEGVFPFCLTHLKDDQAFKRRTLVEYFDVVSRETDEVMVQRMTDGFIPVYLEKLSELSDEE